MCWHVKQKMRRPDLPPVSLPVVLQSLQAQGHCDVADETEEGQLHQPWYVAAPALHDWPCLPLQLALLACASKGVRRDWSPQVGEGGRRGVYVYGRVEEEGEGRSELRESRGWYSQVV